VARRRECRAADACQPRTACASGTLTGPAFGRPDVWRRYLAIILDSLRPERGTVTPLPEPPLSPAGIGTAMREMPRGRPARPHETR
jgi:hypothetical protein